MVGDLEDMQGIEAMLDIMEVHPEGMADIGRR
jgi:hypothetical protein